MAQLQPNMTNWRQLGLALGPRQRTFDPSWALWGQPGAKLGPARANFAGSVRHADNVRFCRYFQSYLALMGQMPHRGPSCARYAQLAPKRAQVAPCWTPVGLKLGPSWGQVGPKCPVRPSRLLVGPSRPASFLSVLVLFPGCGRFSPRSDSNRGHVELAAQSSHYVLNTSPNEYLPYKQATLHRASSFCTSFPR